MIFIIYLLDIQNKGHTPFLTMDAISPMFPVTFCQQLGLV